MSDLEQRLRGRAAFCRDRGEIKTPDLLVSAADRLRQYREALEYYAKWHPQPSEGPWGADSTDFGEIARTALKETTDGVD